MTSRLLPKFENPPVVEVAISVFFKTLPEFKTAHYGKFWRIIETEYPRTEDQQPIVEIPFIDMIASNLPPFRRVFLISENGNLVTQMQSNFFGHNWRRVKESDKYPSFEVPRKHFLQKWDMFKKFARELNVGDIDATRYEITYVNQFVEPKGAFPRAIESYSPVISLHPADGNELLANPKALSAELQFDLPEKLGTLRVSFKQGERVSDKKEVMQVDLTARILVTPSGPDLSNWLERTHEHIAASFVDLTTSEAHRKWGRTQ